MEEQLLETWEIHQRINLYLLDAIPEAALANALPKCRSVHDLFAHVHNVRLLWLKPNAPELTKSLDKLESKKITSKSTLGTALTASGNAIGQLLRNAFANGVKIKGFKPHAPAFVGYLISHESHHRGQIGWTLKQTGSPLDQKTAYGMWEWGVR